MKKHHKDRCRPFVSDDLHPRKKFDVLHISTKVYLGWQILTGKLLSRLFEELTYEYRMQANNGHVFP